MIQQFYSGLYIQKNWKIKQILKIFLLLIFINFSLCLRLILSSLLKLLEKYTQQRSYHFTISVALSTFSLFCSHHHSPSPGLFSSSHIKILYPLDIDFPFLSAPAPGRMTETILATTILLSDSEFDDICHIVIWYMSYSICPFVPAYFT